MKHTRRCIFHMLFLLEDLLGCWIAKRFVLEKELPGEEDFATRGSGVMSVHHGQEQGLIGSSA